MKRKNWIVGEFSVRPKGNPGECFFCKHKLGMQHAKDCAIRERSVVVRATIDVTAYVTEDMPNAMITEAFNDPEWLQGELGYLLELLIREPYRLHEVSTVQYLREATSIDERRAKRRLSDIPS